MIGSGGLPGGKGMPKLPKLPQMANMPAPGQAGGFPAVGGKKRKKGGPWGLIKAR
jgi:hypothetical protein